MPFTESLFNSILLARLAGLTPKYLGCRRAQSHRRTGNIKQPSWRHHLAPVSGDVADALERVLGNVDLALVSVYDKVTPAPFPLPIDDETLDLCDSLALSQESFLVVRVQMFVQQPRAN